MILESKSGQATFFVLGIVFIGIGIGGLINLNDVYLNLVLGDKSTFYYVLNKILTGLILLFIAVCGGAMLWLVFYSIKKCRQFRGEPPLVIEPKKVLMTALFYITILAILAALVILINYLTRNAVVERGMFGQPLHEKSQKSPKRSDKSEQ